MRWSSAVSCRSPRHLAAALLLVSACRLALLRVGVSSGAHSRVESSDGTRRPSADSDRTHCSPLSIVCLADSPPAAEWTRPEAALQALRVRQQHVVLAGHSRLRQVFEHLQPLLEAPLRSRDDRPPPLADRDDPLAPPLPRNSTCLAAVPKLHAAALWCSMAADWGRLLLDFRWRYQTAALSALLGRLAARPPDRLIVAHGLYQAMSAEDVLQLRAGLPRLVSRLERLQRRGTATVGMLEAGASAHAKLQLLWNDDSLLVTNAVFSELLLEAGVPLWSAHLPLTLHWLLRDCRLPPPSSSPACSPNHVHTDSATNLRLVHQLLSALTDTR